MRKQKSKKAFVCHAGKTLLGKCAFHRNAPTTSSLSVGADCINLQLVFGDVGAGCTSPNWFSGTLVQAAQAPTGFRGHWCRLHKPSFLFPSKVPVPGVLKTAVAGISVPRYRLLLSFPKSLLCGSHHRPVPLHAVSVKPLDVAEVLTVRQVLVLGIDTVAHLEAAGVVEAH